MSDLTFESLPPEVHLQLSKYFKVIDIVNVTQLCRSLRSIYQHSYPKQYRVVSKTLIPLNDDPSPLISYKRLVSMTEVTRLPESLIEILVVDFDSDPLLDEIASSTPTFNLANFPKLRKIIFKGCSKLYDFYERFFNSLFYHAILPLPEGLIMEFRGVDKSHFADYLVDQGIPREYLKKVCVGSLLRLPSFDVINLMNLSVLTHLSCELLDLSEVFVTELPKLSHLRYLKFVINLIPTSNAQLAEMVKKLQLLCKLRAPSVEACTLFIQGDETALEELFEDLLPLPFQPRVMECPIVTGINVSDDEQPESKYMKDILSQCILPRCHKLALEFGFYTSSPPYTLNYSIITFFRFQLIPGPDLPKVINLLSQMVNLKHLDMSFLGSVYYVPPEFSLALEKIGKSSFNIGKENTTSLVKKVESLISSFCSCAGASCGCKKAGVSHARFAKEQVEVCAKVFVKILEDPQEVQDFRKSIAQTHVSLWFDRLQAFELMMERIKTFGSLNYFQLTTHTPWHFSPRLYQICCGHQSLKQIFICFSSTDKMTSFAHLFGSGNITAPTFRGIPYADVFVESRDTSKVWTKATQLDSYSVVVDLERKRKFIPNYIREPYYFKSPYHIEFKENEPWIP